MVGVNASLVTKLRKEIRQLVGVHCVAHRETLAIKDRCEQFAELKCVQWINSPIKSVNGWEIHV